MRLEYRCKSVDWNWLANYDLFCAKIKITFQTEQNLHRFYSFVFLQTIRQCKNQTYQHSSPHCRRLKPFCKWASFLLLIEVGASGSFIRFVCFVRLLYIYVLKIDRLIRKGEKTGRINQNVRVLIVGVGHLFFLWFSNLYCNSMKTPKTILSSFGELITHESAICLVLLPFASSFSPFSH